jgi:AcrR family transcriptional regulator
MYLKDPQDTDVGRRIIKNSIELIDELGFESFNFKKLAQRISTTEASVYRYFENKHILLIYLVSWYWEWVHYLIDIETLNIEDPKRKLSIAIDNIINASMENPSVNYVNEAILHRIVIAEGSKAYHTKDVDAENKEGMFLSYKNLSLCLADIIIEVNPEFPYPRSLASNLFEMANNQIYFADHLPRLTDLKGKEAANADLKNLLEFFAFKLLDAIV